MRSRREDFPPFLFPLFLREVVIGKAANAFFRIEFFFYSFVLGKHAAFARVIGSGMDRIFSFPLVSWGRASLTWTILRGPIHPSFSLFPVLLVRPCSGESP